MEKKFSTESNQKSWADFNVLVLAILSWYEMTSNPNHHDL